MSRIVDSSKNIFYGYLGNIITIVIGFISKTIFIYTLGTTYLGVNGLFSNILGVLSFAELGIGSAMNFSLYKPVANRDTEKIKSIMQLYKFAYRIIAIIVAIMGLIILPFLNYLLKGAETLSDVHIYYLIYLFNTVTSYLVSYKFSLLNAEQKNYIYTNISTITNIITCLIQICCLILFQNFMVYLLIGAAIGLFQKVFVSSFLNKKYPFLLEKNVQKLDSTEKSELKKNMTGLVWHKLGEISVYQTDSIIISLFLNVIVVGLVSNYNYIITVIGGFVNIIFNSATASIGNLFATENKQKMYSVFRTYRFTAFWLYGFSSVGFFTLLNQFVTLWLGKSMLISSLAIFFIVLNYYMLGHRICINNFKVSGGIFYQDKYVPFIQAVVNITVSIILIRFIGLAGVYIGTVVQGTVSTIIKPIIIYKELFGRSSKEYFRDSLVFGGAVLLAGIVCNLIVRIKYSSIFAIQFIIEFILVTVCCNLLFYILFRRREEFIRLKYLVINGRRIFRAKSIS